MQLKHYYFISFSFNINIQITQNSKLNVKLSNSQLNKLKSRLKNGTEVTLNLSSNLTRNFIDKTNFPHKTLLNHAQAAKIREAFANHCGKSMEIRSFFWFLF